MFSQGVVATRLHQPSQELILIRTGLAPGTAAVRFGCGAAALADAAPHITHEAHADIKTGGNLGTRTAFLLPSPPYPLTQVQRISCWHGLQPSKGLLNRKTL